MNTNTLLETGHIALWVLVAGLFFPRLTLFFAWLGHGTYPPNPLPDLLNLAAWLFVPRFLMAYYVYIDIGTHNLWFWAYVILGIAGMIGESGYARRRIVRRTTTYPNGDRTVVEEEVV